MIDNLYKLATNLLLTNEKYTSAKGGGKRY